MTNVIEGIDVSNWRGNLEELAQLEGSEAVVISCPNIIGKTEMAAIAEKLALARKKAK